MRDAGLDLRCFCPGRPTAWTTTWRPPQWRQRTEMPTWNNVGRMWRWRRILTLGARCQHVLSTSFKFVNFKSVFSRSNILNWQVGIKWSCNFYLRVRGITCLTVELEPPRRSNGIAIPRALLVSCPTRPKHWSKSSILLKHSGFGSPLCYLVWLLMVRFLPSQPLHTVGSSQWQSKHTPVSELFEHPFVFSLPTFKWWRRWSLFLDMFRHFPNMSWWCHRSCHCTIGQIYEFYESFKAVSEATLLALSPIVMLPTQVHPGLPRCAMLFPLRLTTSSTPSASAWRRVLPSTWSSQVLIWALSRAKCMQKTCLTVSKIWRWAWSCAVSDLSSIRHCLRWLFAIAGKGVAPGRIPTEKLLHHLEKDLRDIEYMSKNLPWWEQAYFKPKNWGKEGSRQRNEPARMRKWSNMACSFANLGSDMAVMTDGGMIPDVAWCRWIRVLSWVVDGLWDTSWHVLTRPKYSNIELGGHGALRALLPSDLQHGGLLRGEPSGEEYVHNHVKSFKWVGHYGHLCRK